MLINLRWTMFLKALSFFVIFVMLMVLAPVATRAATTATVSITATPSFISISNNSTGGPNWNIGAVAQSGTAVTAAEYFVITSTSSVAVNVSIYVSATFTGGTAWTVATNGAPGSMIVGLYSGIVAGSFNDVISPTPGTVLKSMAGTQSSVLQSWHMKLWAPTVFVDGVQKTGTVTLSAAAA